jgi:hypothetical protein
MDLRYEHLIRINDGGEPSIAVLSRAELWRGIVLRAARPELFDAGIDETRMLSETRSQMVREVRRGSAVVAETAVTLTVVSGTSLAGSTLELRIEEPAPAALFVRFIYELRGADVPEAEAERQALKQAYYFADIEAVQHIRSIAERERAESPARPVTAESAGH